MKRLLVVVGVLVLVGVGVGSAVGQGTGGTVGSSAVGTKEFGIQFKGFGCGSIPLRKCFSKARVGQVGAGHATVTDGGTKVGTAIFSNIAGKKMNRRAALNVFHAVLVFDNKVDSITVAGAAADTGPALPYSIVGGTGAYAGARGTVEDRDFDDDGGTVVLTFIP